MNESLLNNHLNYLISRFIRGKKVIIVYKGFPVQFINRVTDTVPYATKSECRFEGQKIDPNKILDNARSLAKKVIEGDLPDSSVMLYEEFNLLSRNLDLSLFQGMFIVVLNDLFDSYPNQSLISVLDFEEEVARGNDDLPSGDLFSKFYSYSTKSGKVNLIQYLQANYANKENVVEVSFFENMIEGRNFVIKDISDEVALSKKGVFYKSDSYDYLKNQLYLSELSNKEINIFISPQVKSDDKELRCFQLLAESSGAKIGIFRFKTASQSNHRNDLIEILERYWKSTEFRDLLFYEQPAITQNKITVSQGGIIDDVITQVENAKDGRTFRDIFLTSPTGAGKSVLFQVPAIYIANKYRLVTIVVSPLIALMFDQVNALKRRGVDFVACLNSDISFLERKKILEQVKNGEISILYLSPELLLSYDIRYFIGERQLGLLVIDEAHLVTTWGRDFRIDYWYIGTYVKRLSKYRGYNSLFPIFAVTATAVYGGSNDTVNETIESLNMRNAKAYIGNVKRKEIEFEIRDFKTEKNHEMAKIEKTISWIKDSVRNNKKSIVYFPYISQIELVRNRLFPIFELRDRIDLYHSRRDGEDKQITMEGFAKGKILSVLATKAFGMGIDVDDIEIIYHHAPSGGLSDYIQEVGRVARKKGLKGKAEIDFCNQDLKFAKMLYGLSSVKQYQVRLVLLKLWNLYSLKKYQNMLVTIDDFGHIFSDKDERERIESKVKSALMLIERDLIRKHNYNVIIARPKSLFSTVFACIPDIIKAKFLEKYGKYTNQVCSRELNARKLWGGNTYDYGDIYEIKLDEIWRTFFDNETFPQVKRKFFMGELFDVGREKEKIDPRYRLSITLNQSPQETAQCVQKYFDILNTAIVDFGGKFFSPEELSAKIKIPLRSESLARKITHLIPNLYSDGDKGSSSIQPRKDKFRAINASFNRVQNEILRYISDMFVPPSPVYNKYLSYEINKIDGFQKVAYLIEAFNLGNYESVGGQHPQIFVRINDPFRLRIIAESSSYNNGIVDDIERRHERSVNIMEKFFSSKMSNDERWHFIENYFLGRPVEISNSGNNNATQ